MVVFEICLRECKFIFLIWIIGEVVSVYIVWDDKYLNIVK